MHNPILVKESEGFIEGRKLLEELDRQNFPVEAALWHRLPEYDSERLIIVSARADNGNLSAYTTIQEALRSLRARSLRLSDVLLMGAHSRRFAELRREIEGVLGFLPREKRPSLDGYVSEDTAIYRWP